MKSILLLAALTSSSLVASAPNFYAEDASLVADALAPRGYDEVAVFSLRAYDNDYGE